MTSEKQYVLNSFSTNFASCKGKRIAIYGLGDNTRLIIENLLDFTIIGLMDELRTGDTVFGKRVLSFAEVSALRVEAIIIVARVGNTKLIYRRIARFCDENAISVFDINGNVLGMDRISGKAIGKYTDVSEAVLREKIQRADIVSFDVFDTLVMRRCLYPRDVFHFLGADFAKVRVQAETELYAEGGHPNIDDIYRRMGHPHSPRQELDLEAEVLIARDKMVDMLLYAARLGKEVWLASDMYLPKEILSTLLGNLGISVPTSRILVSCDVKASKSGGMFDILRSRAGKGCILHIGDNYEADVVGAKRSGIEDVFHIERAAAMLEDCPANTLLKYDSTWQNRLLIGEFIARQLNNPFLFSETRGKFAVESDADLAYSFIAPLIWRFFGWLVERARELRLDQVLLAARDGYLIEQMHTLVKESLDLPPMRYFYISRAIAVLAGLRDGEDIRHAARMAFAGTSERMLRQRFHLDEAEILERIPGESDDEYVLRHKDAIYRKAESAKKRYLRYIGGLGIAPGERTGFFDFISSGTCQKALVNIVDFELFGLYFAGMNYEADYMSDVRIEGLYGTLNNIYEKGWHCIEDQFFLENILTSPEPSLVDFDENGSPIFLPEQRSETQLAGLKAIHSEILDYVRQTRLWRKDILHADKAVPDLIFHFLQDEFCEIKTGSFGKEELLDDFCNRKFVLTPG
jgi:FMN phosphatase YigB (HAD superfamily)